MIRYTNDDKTLTVPKNLGNFPDTETIVTSGITAEECQEMIDESLVGYATTADTQNLQSQIDEISGQTGSQVSVEQIVSAGTKIATISVDGTDTDLYAPASGGGGMTPEQVQQQIDESLVDYPTSAVTQDLDERVTELENASVDYATTGDTADLQTQIDALSGKSEVAWNQIVSAGTKIAEVTIDGVQTDVYAPQGGGPAPTGDTALKAVIYHNGTEDSPFSRDDIAQLQALADALSGLTSGDTVPYAYIDLMDDTSEGDENASLSYRFILTYGDHNGWTFIAPDTDGYTSSFNLNTEDVSQSGVYFGEGWEDAIQNAITNDVQPQIDAITGVTDDLQTQIDALTAQTEDFETRISDLEALTGDTGNIVILDINESNLYSKIDDAINDSKTVILKGPYDYEYQDQIVYLFYSDEPSAYRFRGVKAVASGQVNTFTVTVYENGTFDGTYVNNGTRYISVWGGVQNYTLPTASANALGGVKVGSGLTIDQNGVLSVSGGTSSDGYVWTTDAEYDAMTQAEKEAWYDNIYSGASAGNYKFGIIVTTEPWNPEEHQDLDVKCRSLRLSWVEDGYDSLHFNDANYSDNNFRGMEYRIARGGTWDRIDEKNLDITKFTESSEDRRVFKITTGLTAYGGFDGYMFNRAFSEPQQPWEYYSAVGSMPLLIVSPHQDNPDEYDLVCTANVLACGEAPSNLYIDGWAKRFVFRYFLNGELYEAIMDSVSGGSGDGLHLIHNYSVYGNWVGSQADYNAIGAGNYDDKVIYHIDR